MENPRPEKVAVVTDVQAVWARPKRSSSRSTAA